MNTRETNQSKNPVDEKGGDHTTTFREVVVISDDRTWIWGFARHNLNTMGKEFVRVPSHAPIRQSWNRFRNAEAIIIHWENTGRHGGAIVEEILEIDPYFDVPEKVIILTTDPIHEDVVHFGELGVQKVIRIKNIDTHLEKTSLDLIQMLPHADLPQRRNPWTKLLRALNNLPENSSSEVLKKMDDAVEMLSRTVDKQKTARYYDAKALLAAARGEKEQALSHWQKALHLNPSYFRSYHNMIKFYRRYAEKKQALDLLKRLQMMNKNNIWRMVQMGEIHKECNEDAKAEHYFQSALAKDKYCNGALCGLAEIRFKQGNLEEARGLLARTTVASQTAAALNRQGIDLVKSGHYEEALHHYSKAQYVLPHQEKGPLLFYNIGLCYKRWGKMEMAGEFLKLALVKEPNYEKAKKLLHQIAVPPAA